MKIKNLFYLVAVVLLAGVLFTACSQSSNKSESATDTEMSIEKGDQATKCGGDSDKKCGEGKCGEGKCGEGKEAADSTKKSGEGKSGEGKEATDTTKKCGEGKCGA